MALIPRDSIDRDFYFLKTINIQVKHFCPSVPIILVGNKKDLRNDEAIKRELAKLKLEPVKAEEGRQMASKYLFYLILTIH